MDELQTLQEQRNALAKQIKSQADIFNATEFEGRKKEARTWFDDEQRVAFEQMNVDRNEVDEKIASLRSANDVDAAVAQIDAYENEQRDYSGAGYPDADQSNDDANEQRATDSALCMHAWVLRGHGRPLTDEHRAACKRSGFNPGSQYIDVSLNNRTSNAPTWAVRGANSWENRVLDVGTATKGQETVFDGFIPELEKALLAYGGPRQVSRVIRTEQGNTLYMATADHTAITGRLLAESTTVTATDQTYSQIQLDAYKYSSDEILITAELEQDSFFDMAAEIGASLGERLGRITAQHFTTGTGSSQPQGCVTGASAGVTAASASAIAADELFDMVHSLDPAYRSAGASWMFHDNVLLALRKLQDSNGQYLWQEGMSIGEPDRLLGYPYTINQNMASSIATTNVTALFGLFSKFLIRDVGSVRMYRLPELHRLDDQTGYVAFSRHDSVVAQSSAIKKLTQA